MTPAVGAIGVVSLHSIVADCIEVGEFVYDRRWHATHAVVYLGGGLIAEAAPGGVRIVLLMGYDGTHIRWSTRLLTQAEAVHIVMEAHDIAAENGGKGRPYNYLLYVQLALWRCGVRFPVVKRWIGNPARLDCSQFCDLLYDNAGVHIYDDGRPPGLISPGDLARAMDDGLL